MPEFSQEVFNNSLLMKRLSKNQGSLLNKQKKDDLKIIGSAGYEEPTDQPLFKSNIDPDKVLIAERFGNHLFSDHILFSKSPDSFAVDVNKRYDQAIPINRDLLANNFDLFKSMITSNKPEDGLIFTDQNLKIFAKPKQLEKGVIGVLLSYQCNDKIEDLELVSQNYREFTVLCSKVKYDSNNTVAQALVKVTLLDSFTNPPCVSFTCRVGGMNIRSIFALPVLINKFIDPYDCSRENFFEMWNQFSASKEERIHRLDCIFKNPLDGKKSLMEFLRKVGSLLVSLNFNVYSPENKNNFHELEAGGIISLQNLSFPILIQVGFVPSYTSEFRLSIRSKLPDGNTFSNITLDLYSLLKFYINPN